MAPTSTKKAAIPRPIQKTGGMAAARISEGRVGRRLPTLEAHLILTVQIADVGTRQGLRILSRRPRPESVPGLRYAETLFTAPLGGRRPPAPNFGRVALLATWS